MGKAGRPALTRIAVAWAAALLLLVGCSRPEETEGEPVPKPAAEAPAAAGVAEVFEEGFQRVLNGKYAEARAVLEPLSASPEQDGRVAAAALFWLAWCAEATGQPQEAVRQYERVVVSHPRDGYAAVAAERLRGLRARSGTTVK
jgi:TolA-binding protein